MNAKLEEWLLFLADPNNKKLEEIMEREPAIKKAMNALDIISQSEEERRLYEDRLRALLDYNSNMDRAQEKGLELGIAQGIEKGMEQGMEKGKLEVAKNMLKNGYDLKTVSEISGIKMDDLSKSI